MARQVMKAYVCEELANIGPTTQKEAVVIYLPSNTSTNCIILSQLEDEPGVHHHCTRAHWPGQPLSY